MGHSPRHVSLLQLLPTAQRIVQPQCQRAAENILDERNLMHKIYLEVLCSECVFHMQHPFIESLTERDVKLYRVQ